MTGCLATEEIVTMQRLVVRQDILVFTNDPPDAQVKIESNPDNFSNKVPAGSESITGTFF